MNEETLEGDESRTSWRETKITQIKLAMTCNKNEQQQNAKINAELQTTWLKMTWTTFEETITETKTGLLRPNS